MNMDRLSFNRIMGLFPPFRQRRSYPSIQVLFERAEKALCDCDCPKAIATLTQIIQRDPTNVEAWRCRGIAHRDMGDLQRAVTDFDRAIALSPEDANAYLYRGICWVRLEKLDQALEDFNRAVALERSAIGLMNRGLARDLLGDQRSALADLQEAACGFLQNQNLDLYEVVQTEIWELEQELATRH